MFSALRASYREDHSLGHFQTNLLSGITVGVIALPLSMALAIASGVAPQHGLYTAIIAGIITAVCGGSRVNILVRRRHLLLFCCLLFICMDWVVYC